MLEIISVFVIGWLITNRARKERKQINKAINELHKDWSKPLDCKVINFLTEGIVNEYIYIPHHKFDNSEYNMGTIKSLRYFSPYKT